MFKPVLFTNFFEQRKTIETLIEESRADANFYLLLSFATLITTLGLLINNALVIVGGILVAPFLFPVLSLGMGIATSSAEAIKRAFGIILRAIITVVLISFVTAFLINEQGATEQIYLASSPNFLFFFIAFSAGIIAAYSWVKQNLSTTMPSVSITVSLLPPLASIGIAFSLLSRDILSGSLMLFLLNLIGIVLASTIVFSLFGFLELQQWQEKKIQEEKQEKEGVGEPPTPQP
jgi:uncharacterized hydrophobic protein (TIGR00271 family)